MKRTSVIATTALGTTLALGAIGIGTAVLPSVAGAQCTDVAQVARPTPPPTVKGHPRLRDLARHEFKLAADTIGIPAKELRHDVKGGQSISEVAEAHGVGTQTVVDAVVGDLSGQARHRRHRRQDHPGAGRPHRAAPARAGHRPGQPPPGRRPARQLIRRPAGSGRPSDRGPRAGGARSRSGPVTVRGQSSGDPKITSMQASRRRRTSPSRWRRATSRRRRLNTAAHTRVSMGSTHCSSTPSSASRTTPARRSGERFVAAGHLGVVGGLQRDHAARRTGGHARSPSGRRPGCDGAGRRGRGSAERIDRS